MDIWDDYYSTLYIHAQDKRRASKSLLIQQQSQITSERDATVNACQVYPGSWYKTGFVYGRLFGLKTRSIPRICTKMTKFGTKIECKCFRFTGRGIILASVYGIKKLK